jgi:hypothetical protein
VSVLQFVLGWVGLDIRETTQEVRRFKLDGWMGQQLF